MPKKVFLRVKQFSWCLSEKHEHNFIDVKLITINTQKMIDRKLKPKLRIISISHNAIAATMTFTRQPVTFNAIFNAIIITASVKSIDKRGLIYSLPNWWFLLNAIDIIL